MLSQAKVTHQEEKDTEFVKKCSSVSQALEERFMSLLLLFSDYNACIGTAVEKELHIHEALQTIGSLQFIGESCKTVTKYIVTMGCNVCR